MSKLSIHFKTFDVNFITENDGGAFKLLAFERYKKDIQV